jgi:hypothetical protein
MRTDNLQVSQIAPEGFAFAPGIESAVCPSVLVDEGYFDTTGIRIVEGRGFRATDTRDTPQVTIVNQRFAERYWPGQSVIGKRVNIRAPRLARWRSSASPPTRATSSSSNRRWSSCISRTRRARCRGVR